MQGCPQELMKQDSMFMRATSHAPVTSLSQASSHPVSPHMHWPVQVEKLAHALVYAVSCVAHMSSMHDPQVGEPVEPASPWQFMKPELLLGQSDAQSLATHVATDWTVSGQSPASGEQACWQPVSPAAQGQKQP
jgi:hypothetical protein